MLFLFVYKLHNFLFAKTGAVHKCHYRLNFVIIFFNFSVFVTLSYSSLKLPLFKATLLVKSFIISIFKSISFNTQNSFFFSIQKSTSKLTCIYLQLPNIIIYTVMFSFYDTTLLYFYIYNCKFLLRQKHKQNTNIINITMFSFEYLNI